MASLSERPWPTQRSSWTPSRRVCGRPLVARAQSWLTVAIARDSLKLKGAFGFRLRRLLFWLPKGVNFSFLSVTKMVSSLCWAQHLTTRACLSLLQPPSWPLDLLLLAMSWQWNFYLVLVKVTLFISWLLWYCIHDTLFDVVSSNNHCRCSCRLCPLAQVFDGYGCLYQIAACQGEYGKTVIYARDSLKLEAKGL